MSNSKPASSQQVETSGGKVVRRRYPRRIFRRGIGVLTGGRYFLVQGGEIGEGGISFRTTEALKMGALIVVSFQIPDGQFVSVRAEIRNEESVTSDTLYGCAFENITFERKREIRNFVTNRPESES